MVKLRRSRDNSTLRLQLSFCSHYLTVGQAISRFLGLKVYSIGIGLCLKTIFNYVKINTTKYAGRINDVEITKLPVSLFKNDN